MTPKGNNKWTDEQRLLVKSWALPDLLQFKANDLFEKSELECDCFGFVIIKHTEGD